MKRRTKKCNVNKERGYHVIEYPPGYRGQPLTHDSITFSDHFFESTEKHVWFVKSLLKNFAAEVGCGDSQESLDYLESVTKGGDYCWSPSYLPGVLVISFEEKSEKSQKRMLLLTTMREMSEFIGVSEKSDPDHDDRNAFDEQFSNKTSARVFH
jgi:hypothetical protein